MVQFSIYSSNALFGVTVMGTRKRFDTFMCEECCKHIHQGFIKIIPWSIRNLDASVKLWMDTPSIIKGSVGDVDCTGVISMGFSHSTALQVAVL